VSTLEKHGTIDQDYLASDFGNRYDSGRGYGPAMHELLPKLRRQPSSWNHESEALFGGTGSFGNGSAMRVAPLGAYFADDLDKLNAEAERSAVVTHCHAEAVAGAVAVAMAAAVATQAANRENALTFSEFLDQVRERTPSSTVQSGIRRAIEIGPDAPVSTAVQALGNGKRVSAPDTVPFCLWAAARHLSDYEAAMWTTVSGLGDRDTTCAIVGGIVVMSAGLDSIRKAWLEHRVPLGK
jgi:ADP-ribosylglycohydrolase